MWHAQEHYNSYTQPLINLVLAHSLGRVRFCLKILHNSLHFFFTKLKWKNTLIFTIQLSWYWLFRVYVGENSRTFQDLIVDSRTFQGFLAFKDSSRIYSKIQGLFKDLCAVKPKTQCNWLTSDYTCTYELELERRCMFNKLVFSPNGFYELECSFSFRCFTPSQTLLFCNKHRWHMQIYAMNETRTFCAMDDHVERSVLTSIKTKTVRIKSLFFQVRKFFKSYSSYM